MGVRFDCSGNEYRVAEVEDGKSLVWTQVLDGDGEVYDGELRIISKSALHDAPPRLKLDNQIAELQAIREDLSLQIRKLRQELKSFEDGANDRMAKLKRHKSLERLDDYLAGRITHYVESTTYSPPKIVIFEDTKTDDAGSRRDKLKLLTLFGRTNGNLEWGLNRYSDGSGINTTVVPCTSHSEAVKVVAELFVTHENKAADPTDRTTSNQAWLERVVGYGITVSPGYKRDLEARKVEAKQTNIAKLEAQIEKLQKA